MTWPKDDWVTGVISLLVGVIDSTYYITSEKVFRPPPKKYTPKTLNPSLKRYVGMSSYEVFKLNSELVFFDSMEA